jgi:hypothetical protein
MLKQHRLQMRQAPCRSQAKWSNCNWHQLDKGKQEMLFFDSDAADASLWQRFRERSSFSEAEQQAADKITKHDADEAAMLVSNMVRDPIQIKRQNDLASAESERDLFVCCSSLLLIDKSYIGPG